jgi:hypothetical protein
VTFSNLKIELIATGEQSGTWGGITNNNLGSNSVGSRGLEQAVVGMATLITADFTANSYTLAYTIPTMLRTSGRWFLILRPP